MKKKKRVKYKRRTVIYTCLLLFIIFSIINYYTETYGLPDYLIKAIKQKFHKKGFNITFVSSHLGVLNGLVLTKPLIRGLKHKNHYIKADSFHLGVTFSFFEPYFFKISSLRVINGELQLPLFPETLEEGANDVIKISQINAGFFFTGNNVNVKQLSGRFEPFKFMAAGIIKNISTPEFSKIPKGKQADFNYLFSFIESISLNAREAFYLKYLEIKKGSIFELSNPELSIAFNLDGKNVDKSNIRLFVKANNFSYMNLDIEKMVSSISIRNEKAELEKFILKLQHNSGNLKITGKLDLKQLNLTGNANLIMVPDSLRRILKNNKILPDYISIANKPLKIKAKLNNFSLKSMDFIGKAIIKIPDVFVKNVKLSNVKLSVDISDSNLNADDFSFNTGLNQVTGFFDYSLQSQVVNLHLDTIGPPFVLRNFLSGPPLENYDIIADMTELPENPEDIQCSMDIHVDPEDNFFSFISGKLKINKFKYNGVYFDTGETHFFLDSNPILIVPDLVLKRSDKICNASIVYDLSDGIEYKVKTDDFYTVKGAQDCVYANLEGNFPGFEYIKCIFPVWHSKVLDLSPSAHIKGDGMVDFNNIENIFFLIKIYDSNCFWQNIKVQNFNADLLFNQEIMSLINASGKVYDGDIAFNYNYNLETFKGDIDISLANANFAPLANSISGYGLQKQEKGVISFLSSNQFEYDKDDNISIFGHAKAWIRKADLWDVPIINEFGNISKKWIGKDWGDITSLDADFDFKKDHMYSDNIRTDGTVISLQAKGSYYWENPENNNQDAFSYVIKAKILENAFILKYLSHLNPLAWFLKSRVYKKNGKVEWEKAYVVKKIFGIKKNEN